MRPEQDSSGWNMPQLTSSLLDELILLPLKPAVKHVFFCFFFFFKSAQKMRRANFSQWLTHLYLALSFGGSPLQGRSSVALEGFSFLFLST